MHCEHKLASPSVCLAMLVTGCVLPLNAGCQNATTPRPANAAAPETTAASETTAPAKEVAVAEVRLQTWPSTVRVQGSLLADQRAVVGSKLAGRVETVAVDLGSVVRTGQPMVTLDRRELEAHVRQVEAQLRQACAVLGLTPEDDESQFRHQQAPSAMLEQALVDEAKAAVERGKELLPEQAIAQSEFDRLLAQLKTAEARYATALNTVNEQIALIGVRRAELEQARQELAEAEIIAPFDGVVAQRHVVPGEYVQLGQAAVTLVRSGRLRFTAGVPESVARRIRIGQPVSIRVAEVPRPIVVSISRVSPAVTQTSRSLWIEADVPNPDYALQTGLFAEAEITVDADAQALAIPAEAVNTFAGVQKVWLVRDGEARQQTIVTGRHDGRRVEVLDGLSSGDLVVRRAAAGHDGPVVAVGGPAATELHTTLSDTSSGKGLLE